MRAGACARQLFATPLDRPSVSLGLQVLGLASVRVSNMYGMTLQEAGLKVKEYELLRRNFSETGNFGFGISEHIDLGIKYDPSTGIYGALPSCLEAEQCTVERQPISHRMHGKPLDILITPCALPLRAEAYEPGGTADPSRRSRVGCLHSIPPRSPGAMAGSSPASHARGARHKQTMTPKQWLVAP